MVGVSLPVRDPVQPPVRPPVLPAVAEPTVVPTWLIAVAIVSGLAVLGALGFVVVHVSSVAAAQPVGVAAPVPQVGPTVPVETPSTPRPVTTGVNPAWAARVGAEAGIPVPAMLAYGDAELTLDHQQPSCHLSWNTLAGIGWIES
ncbi:MAG: rane-bound lytic murein transglycosylase, partial [Marmoricola sp.]|nr:rane-bound lytic murein transglycosylase [Marmoricola sp.]